MLTVQKNTEDLVVASKEIDLEVNAEKTKYMVTSQDQNVGQNHNIKVGNKLWTGGTVKIYVNNPNKSNSIHEEIKNRLKSGNAFLSFGAESSVFQFAIQKYKD